MEKDKILLVENSELMTSFLKEKLFQFGFEVITSHDTFDALIKLKNNIPDLLIMDYYFIKNSKIDFLKEKYENKTVKDIPIILTASKLDLDSLFNIAKNKIYKIFLKPILIEDLLNTISELMKKKFLFDKTPCIIDVTLNDNILFIDVAKGLNVDKIDSLKFKILELKKLYKIETFKILLIITDLDLQESDYKKFYNLIETLLKYGNTNIGYIKILTHIKQIKDIISKNEKFKYLEITDNVDDAIIKLTDTDIEELLATASTKEDEDRNTFFWKNELNNFEINADKLLNISEVERVIRACIIDDDPFILEYIKDSLIQTGWLIKTYNNAKDFIDDLKNFTPDILFLDIMMPVMSGFDLLEYIKRKNYTFPVIILSALSQKETVKKALSYNIKSYIIKPVEPDLILKKAYEALNMDF